MFLHKKLFSINKNIFSEFASSDKIIVIQNGINLDQYSIQLPDVKSKYKIDSDFVLFVGRFAKVKGVDILLNAWKKVSGVDHNNTKLVIMGVDFGFESEMMSMIEDLDLKDSTIVIKNPPREDVLGAYSQCLFLALPSRWELSPLTPLEGFAFRKPTISTTAHGIPHTIENDENSILVESENSDRLADAILDLIGDKNKRSRLGDSGFKLVQEICNFMNKGHNLITFVEDRKGHDFRYSLNSTKIKRNFNWSPKVTLEEGLKDLIENYEIYQRNMK